MIVCDERWRSTQLGLSDFSSRLNVTVPNSKELLKHSFPTASSGEKHLGDDEKDFVDETKFISVGWLPDNRMTVERTGDIITRLTIEFPFSRDFPQYGSVKNSLMHISPTAPTERLYSNNQLRVSRIVAARTTPNEIAKFLVDIFFTGAEPRIIKEIRFEGCRVFLDRCNWPVLP